MAVVDVYGNPDIVAGVRAVPAEFSGSPIRGIIGIATVAAADDNASIYRIARVQSTLIPFRFTIFNEAITTGTDYDLGLYETKDGPLAGAVLDVDAFVNTIDLSSARSPENDDGANGFITYLLDADLSIAEQKLYEIAGQTAADHSAQVDIAFTANVVGSAQGEIRVYMEFLQG